jgi:hypothetical protein
MSDEKPRECTPKGRSFVTGQKALIYEVERVHGQLNKLTDLQLDEPFLRAVAVEIRAYTDHLGATFQKLTEPCADVKR